MAKDTSGAESHHPKRQGLLKDHDKLVGDANSLKAFRNLHSLAPLKFELCSFLIVSLSYRLLVFSWTLEVPSSRIVIIEGIYALSEKLRPLLDLRSARKVTVDQIKPVLSEDYKETMEQIYDIYLLPPGEDQESCQSYLRMRNKDGKYNLMFEELVADAPFIISPRITFEVTVKTPQWADGLGIHIAAILQRSSHSFSDDRVCVKIDWLGQLNRQYVQVQGRDRVVVKYIAEQLGLEGSYTPRTYIEQIQLERLVNEVMALPDDLKTKLSLDEDLVSSPKKHFCKPLLIGLPGDLRMAKGSLPIQLCYDSLHPTLFVTLLISLYVDDRNLESPAALANQLYDEAISGIARAQRQVTCQLDTLSNLLRDSLGERFQGVRKNRNSLAVRDRPSSPYCSIGDWLCRIMLVYSSPELTLLRGCQWEMDSISDRPQSIIERILTRLPVRDAVRTIVLSSKWRYRWTTLTLFSKTNVLGCTVIDRPVVENRMVKFITHALFLHQGPVHKFQLSTSYLQCFPDIDQWILFLSRSDIKELVLELGEGEWFRVPSCLFNCKS
ncbi:hypothetical protein POTOM_060470 [Populus tomentosa]|uniref:CYTH domain-containing protein n=1 Tax=Populus tomentosa TaxID=118781 RepID=A0A8X8C0Z0_POPTO|nr:hypothetical protein POTOM_060470 [Populus tomentosa]